MASQLTLDQVQGLTWFWFQSVSWSGEALSEVLKSKSASPASIIKIHSKLDVMPNNTSRKHLISFLYIFNVLSLTTFYATLEKKTYCNSTHTISTVVSGVVIAYWSTALKMIVIIKVWNRYTLSVRGYQIQISQY